MTFEVNVINPKTAEQRVVLVTLSRDQFDGLNASACQQSFVQSLAASEIPFGFMPLGNGVRTVTLQ